MDIALTGATGHLGHALVPALLQAGHQVRLLHRHRPGRELPPAPPGLTHHRVNPLDVASVAQALQGAQAVVHAAAALTGDLATQHQATVTGTEVMLQAMRQAGVTRLVGISSLSVYGYAALPPGSTLNERSPLETRPQERDVYTRCKLAQDALFRQFADTGATVVVLRPGIFHATPCPWPFSLGRALPGRRWLLMGPLTAQAEVPLVHVADVAQSIVCALNRLQPPQTPALQVFNIVTPPAPRATELLAWLQQRPDAPTCLRFPWGLHQGLAQLAQGLNRLSGHRLPLPGLLRPRWLSARFTQVHYDSRLALEGLGWQPRHPSTP
jgi:nucleoside-diphosphate-sugar epimerase